MTTDLPAPPGWTAGALCAQLDPDLWFPEAGASSLPAKRVCRECFVAAECLEYALERRIWFGVWGGVDEHDRRALADATWNDNTTTGEVA